MHPFKLSKHKEIITEPVETVDNNSNGRPFLSTNSWRALRQRLLRTPELALVSLAGTRCSNVRYQSSKLGIKSELSVNTLSPNSCNKIKLLQQTTQTLPYCFSLFPQ